MICNSIAVLTIFDALIVVGVLFLSAIFSRTEIDLQRAVRMPGSLRPWSGCRYTVCQN